MIRKRYKYPHFLRQEFVVGDRYTNGVGKQIEIIEVYNDGEIRITSTSYGESYRIVANNVRRSLATGLYKNFIPKNQNEENRDQSNEEEFDEEYIDNSKPTRREFKDFADWHRYQNSNNEEGIDTPESSRENGGAIRVQTQIRKVRLRKVDTYDEIKAKQIKARIRGNEILSSELEFSAISRYATRIQTVS